MGVALSINLWLPIRGFPLLPIVDFLEYSPLWISYFLLILFLGSLVTAIFNNSKIWVFLILGSIILLGLQDQMRWQPWVYIYSLILYCLLFSKNDKDLDIKTLGCVQLLLIGIYIWSGVHKLNQNFIDFTYHDILKSVFRITNQGAFINLRPFGYSIPALEILTGLFLLIPITRKVGVYLAFIIHIFIILYLSPLGINKNQIVIPWNISMVLFVFLSFYQTKNKIAFKAAKKDRTTIQKVLIVLLIWIMPFFNFFTWWDSYFSFSLYSDKVSDYYIAIEEDEIGKIDKRLFSFFVIIPNLKGGQLIDVNKWANKELNVPFYPEDRVFEKLSKTFCSIGIANDKLVFLKIGKYPKRNQYSSFKCSEIK